MKSQPQKLLTTSPLKYVGAKFKQRKFLMTKITELCPDRKLMQYRELFCGSGAVALELMQNKIFSSYWLNDSDFGVYSYWKALKDKYFWMKEIMRAKDVNYFIELYEMYRNDLLKLKRKPDDNEVCEIAIGKLIVQRMSYNGMGTKSSSPAKNIDDRWNQKNLRNALNTIHKLLNECETKITQGDFERLIWDTSHASFLYIDPPYYKMGNELYQSGFSEKDHIRLAQALKESGQPFLLSYDYCVEVLDLYYPFADFEIFDVFYHGNKKVKKEIIIYNR